MNIATALGITTLSIMTFSITAEHFLCLVSFMLTVTYKPFMLSVIMLNVVMLSVFGAVEAPYCNNATSFPPLKSFIVQAPESISIKL
jgi:hypothetical protein